MVDFDPARLLVICQSPKRDLDGFFDLRKHKKFKDTFNTRGYPFDLKFKRSPDLPVQPGISDFAKKWVSPELTHDPILSTHGYISLETLAFFPLKKKSKESNNQKMSSVTKRKADLEFRENPQKAAEDQDQKRSKVPPGYICIYCLRSQTIVFPHLGQEIHGTIFGYESIVPDILSRDPYYLHHPEKAKRLENKLGYHCVNCWRFAVKDHCPTKMLKVLNYCMGNIMDLAERRIAPWKSMHDFDDEQRIKGKSGYTAGDQFSVLLRSCHK